MPTTSTPRRHRGERSGARVLAIGSAAFNKHQSIQEALDILHAGVQGIQA